MGIFRDETPNLYQLVARQNAYLEGQAKRDAAAAKAATNAQWQAEYEQRARVRRAQKAEVARELDEARALMHDRNARAQDILAAAPDSVTAAHALANFDAAYAPYVAHNKTARRQLKSTVRNRQYVFPRTPDEWKSAWRGRLYRRIAWAVLAIFVGSFLSEGSGSSPIWHLLGFVVAAALVAPSFVALKKANEAMANEAPEEAA